MRSILAGVRPFVINIHKGSDDYADFEYRGAEEQELPLALHIEDIVSPEECVGQAAKYMNEFLNRIHMGSYRSAVDCFNRCYITLQECAKKQR